jgi:hypothetical protein
MATQLQVIQAIMDIVSQVSGIREAPDYPPEQLSDFPFAVAFPSEGTHFFGVVGERKFIGNVILEIHVSRVDLPNAVANSIGFGDSIPNALLKSPTLTGTADTFESVAQTFGELNWGDTQTLGYRFTITNIKVRTTIT